MSRVRPLTLVAVVFALLIAPGAAQATDLIYVTTAVPPHLASFYADEPGTVLTDVAVSGLGSGDVVQGLDARPKDGGLYLLTRNAAGVGKIWTVDPVTGAATLVSTLAADPTDSTAPYTALNSGAMAVDFNPFSDRLRVIALGLQNMRVNVDTGFVFTDSNMNPAAQYPGAAYTNNDNDPATTGTTLYGYDFTNDDVGTINPPNNGQFNLVGDPGFTSNNADAVAMDVSRTGIPYASHRRVGPTRDELYTVNLSNGAHTLVGIIGSGPSTTGMTAAMPNLFTVQSAGSTAAESAGTARVNVVKTNSNGAASVAYTTADGTATAGSDYTATSGTLNFNGLETVKAIDVPIADDTDDEGVETFSLSLSVSPSALAVAGPPSTATVSIADDDPTTSPPVVIQLPPVNPPADDAACDKAKAKLAKAKAKLKKLKQQDAPKKAIDKAKAKVKKSKDAVKAACG